MFSVQAPLPIEALCVIPTYELSVLCVITASLPFPVTIIDGHPHLELSNLIVGFASQVPFE